MSELISRPPVVRQVEQVLQRARWLPVGSARNDLRRFAQALLKLHRAGIEIEVLEPPTTQ